MNEDTGYLPYHRKYRPTTIKGYIGNEKLKTTVMNALSGGKRPQVILLHGASGCGKTTFARLLAKEYSCIDRNEETGACGVCDYCKTIDDYITTGDTSVLTNIQEIDITDQNGKNDLTAVLEDMALPSYGDEWKIYIFDECHMATPALQNRLLKIAEEPPEHVLMIFCTTNPEKLIETLKNRCQLTLFVQKPKVNELAGLLRYVCECEQIPYDRKGLEFIANREELTIRKALTSLEQVVTEQNSAKYENAIQVFEEIADTLIVDLLTALKEHDTFSFVNVLFNIKSKHSLQVFLNSMLTFVQRGIYTINGCHIEGVSDRELLIYKKLFSDMGIAELSALMSRLLSLNTKNLEIELLNLAYSGLEKEPAKVELNITPIENELMKEEAMANKVIKAKNEEEYNKGVSNASSLMSTASIDSILSLGGTIIN